VYARKGPKYFFPAMIAVKLPIGLSVLSLLGLIFFFARCLPAEWNFPVGVILASALLFLLVLSQGATYAGIRHAMPVVALLAIFAGVFVGRAMASNSRGLKAMVLAGYFFAGASALPLLRPWEYFNEFVGGTRNAHNYFDDEGVGIGQRTKEMVEYYRKFVKPSAEMPYVICNSSDQELRGRFMEYLGSDLERDLPRLSEPETSGTVFVESGFLSPNPFWDRRALREATPVARFGNLFVYHGTFSSPADAAAALYGNGIEKLYAEKPDLAVAEESFRESLGIDPSAFFVNIELGNLLLKRGARQEALRAYSDALKYAPEDPFFREPIGEQIARFAHQPLGEIPPLRNPFLE
jgi:hypothetical protein